MYLAMHHTSLEESRDAAEYPMVGQSAIPFYGCARARPRTHALEPEHPYAPGFAERLKAALFDVDGTLTDSDHIHFAV